MATGFTPLPAADTPSTAEVMDSLVQSARMIRAAAIQAPDGSPHKKELEDRARLRESMVKTMEGMASKGVQLFSEPDGAAEKKVLMRAADDDLQVAYRFMSPESRPLHPFKAPNDFLNPAMQVGLVTSQPAQPTLLHTGFTPMNFQIHSAGNTPGRSEAGQTDPQPKSKGSSAHTRVPKLQSPRLKAEIDPKASEMLRIKKERLQTSPKTVSNKSWSSGQEMLEELRRKKWELEAQLLAISKQERMYASTKLTSSGSSPSDSVGAAPPIFQPLFAQRPPTLPINPEIFETASSITGIVLPKAPGLIPPTRGLLFRVKLYYQARGISQEEIGSGSGRR